MWRNRAEKQQRKYLANYQKTSIRYAQMEGWYKINVVVFKVICLVIDCSQRAKEYNCRHIIREARK